MPLNSNKLLEKRSWTGKNKLYRSISRHKFLYLMLAPIVIQYFIFYYIPLYGVTIAFKNYQIAKGVFASPWVGLDNIKFLMSGVLFKTVFWNTMIINVLKFLASVPGPIILALMLNEINGRFFKKNIQTISYLPHFLSWVVLAGMFIEILSPTRGFLNLMLDKLGFETIYFLGDSKYFRFTLVMTSIWKNVGWSSIIYVAALGNVDPQLYDSASIDGAGRIRKIVSITIPTLMPLIIIMLLLNIGRMMVDDFQQIYNLINPAVSRVGQTLSVYTYEKGIKDMNYSFAAAVGLFTNVISFILLMMTSVFAKKYSDYGLW